MGTVRRVPAPNLILGAILRQAPNLVVAAIVVLALGVLGRRWIVEAVREIRAGAARYLGEVGWAHLLALAAIFGVGVWLRLHFFDAPMRWDESYSFSAYGSQPFGHVASTYDTVNNHVFANLLMHLSVVLFGSGREEHLSVVSFIAGPEAIRAPVLVAGALVPVVTYVGALRIYGRQAALVTAALVAVSSELIEYSTNARGYEIESLAAVSLLALAPSLLRSSNPAYWGLFTLISGLGFYTVPAFVYPFAVLWVALALAGLIGQSAEGRRRFFVSLTVATAAALGFTALLYGPILGDMLRLTFRAAESTETVQITSGGAGDGDHPLSYLWHIWTFGLPDVAKATLAAGFVVATASVIRGAKAAFPLAAALLRGGRDVDRRGKAAIHGHRAGLAPASPTRPRGVDRRSTGVATGEGRACRRSAESRGEPGGGGHRGVAGGRRSFDRRICESASDVPAVCTCRGRRHRAATQAP